MSLCVMKLSIHGMSRTTKPIVWGGTVAPWLQKSSKNQIIHGIIGITVQHIVPKENLSH